MRQERIKVSRIQGWGPLNIEEVDHARSLELLLVTWGEDANKGEVGKNCAELAWSGAGEHSYSVGTSSPATWARGLGLCCFPKILPRDAKEVYVLI